MATGSGSSRLVPQRTRSNFLTRTATDDAAQLDRRHSVAHSTAEEPRLSRPFTARSNPDEVRMESSEPLPPTNTLPRSLSGSLDRASEPLLVKKKSIGNGRLPARNYGSLTAEVHHRAESRDVEGGASISRPGALPRPVGGSAKLGTFSGVFVPTSLNVLSILMFIRFGFILGQSGLLGMMGMLVVSYLINLITTFSLSAIATNGTVRGGGAYYLISRSLGPEFGGSIGIVFYLGSLLNTSMNAVGLIDCFKQNFGTTSGNWAHWLPEGLWWDYLWATTVLVLCTGISLAGSGIFARCSNGLLALLLVAIISIPFSTFVVPPFRNQVPVIDYTGLSIQTLKDNLLPNFTRHAAGSRLHTKENFQDLFGILFPATGGIFAGASMSGDLKHPSKAIPKGTLSGLALTFAAYTIVILAMSSSISRETFYNNLNVIQDINISGLLILLGEFATCFFSALMGVVGSAKLLQALGRDSLIPGFSIFGQGNKYNEEPTYAILLTYLIAQVAMIFDINQLASFVSMTYLMTFLVTNLACFLLKISSAPNFRPSFHYFNLWTAGCGTLICGASMFFVDGGYASGCVGILITIFVIIHYFSPPKTWGDVSQSLIYHQVRKYLLRLRQEHVKFWRPQILLLVNDPRQQYKLIQFCNALKKGALFVLGHVIVANDFGTAVPEARRQQAAWGKYIDFSRIKAFVNIAISPSIEWGSRSLILGAGLGGMRPNIVIMGYYNLEKYRQSQNPTDASISPSRKPTLEGTVVNQKVEKQIKNRHHKTLSADEVLPTDACQTEGDVSPDSYVTILEDLMLRLQINVALAKGFQNLEFPLPKRRNTKRYIDLWPIQMSAEITAEDNEDKHNLLTTNFDTYTLILQLGCILDTVPSWKENYRLRVAVFVEYESDVDEERSRVETLLRNLRIQAEVLVFWLASGDLKSYQLIVNDNVVMGSEDTEAKVDEVLSGEEWWLEIKKLRGKRGSKSTNQDISDVRNLIGNAANWPSPSFRSNPQESNLERFEGLKKLLQSPRRRASSGELSGFGVRLGMRTHHLQNYLAHRYASYASASEDSDSDGDSDSKVFENDSEGDRAVEHYKSPILGGVGKIEIGDGNSRARSPIKFNRSRSEGTLGRDSTSQLLQTPTDTKDHQPPKPPESLSSISSPERPITAISDLAPLATSDAKQARNLRPRPERRASARKFSSRPVPEARVASDEALGPSIMFTESSGTPGGDPYQSIYQRNLSPQSNRATGFPFQQSVPLSFNDLPCRAQHLILNELMQQQSEHTAVLFTTLPSPVEGTCQSLDESLSYIGDLEILCKGLPPVLLIHSNSMTVTTNL